MKEEKKIYSDIECILYTQDTENFVLEDKPIVTVSVITYNSSRYVKETLESIKDQTYHNLILQISDDCSTDNTIDICKKWIAENQSRFVKTKIVVPNINTGVSANCNRSWDESETEWLKDIAGDDVLLPNCIENNMLYIKGHPEAVFVFSRVQCFGVNDDRINYMELHFDYLKFEWLPEEQLEYFLRFQNFVPASTAFVNVIKIREIGIRHDERIPLCEDLPKWINVLRAGLKLNFMNKDTVRYRISDDSLSTNKHFSPAYVRTLKLLYFYYIFEERYKKDSANTVNTIVDEYMRLYSFHWRISNMLLIKVYKRIIRSFRR